MRAQRNRNASTVVKRESIQPVQPHQMVIKEILDGMGTVLDQDRSLSSFVRTTREKEWELGLPSNGPSPVPTKYTKRWGLVESKSPRLINSTQPRFLSKTELDEIRRRVGNPRVDEFEGVRSILGQTSSCNKCKDRREKVEKNWLLQPLLTSMYAKELSPQIGSRTTMNKNSSLKRARQGSE
jgi:hypothetical protein